MRAQETPRQSARQLGVIVGVLPPGPKNAITDVAGVRVGQKTITDGQTINTGVTAILPHGGNPFQEKVPAAIVASWSSKRYVCAPVRRSKKRTWSFVATARWSPITAGVTFTNPAFSRRDQSRAPVCASRPTR